MRTIKFRAWDKKEKWMFPVEQWAKDSWVAIPVQTSEEEWELQQLRLEDIFLMQYTGLKDKNGKEIYESDIVKVNGQNKLVVYRAPGFYLSPNQEEDYALNTFSTPTILEEVIGNIYENKELL